MDQQYIEILFFWKIVLGFFKGGIRYIDIIFNKNTFIFKLIKSADNFQHVVLVLLYTLLVLRVA